MLEQAKKVVQWHGRSALLPVWAKSFWQEVGLLQPLERRLKVLLLGQSYLGRGVGTPPRLKELKEKLEKLSAAGAVSRLFEAFRAKRAGALSMWISSTWRRWSTSRPKREARHKRGSEHNCAGSHLLRGGAAPPGRLDS